MNRYHRQIIFPGLGEEGQSKLGKAKVVLVGAGGLGSTLAQCMVRSGVGGLTIIDDDVVDITNLHRQFLFDEQDAGQKVPNALVAEKKLKMADSNVEIVGIAERLTTSTAGRLLSGHDLVLDGADNMETRYVVNDWCVKNNTPMIHGGISGATGMVMVIIPGKGPCLRCLYPSTEPSGPEDSPPPKPPPVINTIPTAIAAFQATEATKYLIGSPNLIRDLIIIDLWTGDYQRVPIDQDSNCSCNWD